MKLVERVMGADFGQLDAEVQALHRGSGIRSGRIDVHTAPLARLFGFPPSAKGAMLWFAVREEDGNAIWMRQINDREVRSEISVAGPHLAERLNGMMVVSEPVCEDGALVLRPLAMRAFDIPLPQALWPKVTMREWGEDGRYRFRVEIRAPLTRGRLLAYEGWLNLEPER